MGSPISKKSLPSLGGKTLAVLLSATALTPWDAFGQDATWLSSPGSSSFNTGSNWSSGSVPTGVATFGTSGTTSISVGGSQTVGTLQFTAGGSAYTFAGGSLTLTGAGIVNNSGQTQTFNLATGSLTFSNAATAGNATIAVGASGTLTFNDSSTAGSAAITNNGGLVRFTGSSTSASASFVGNAGTFELSGTNATVILGSIAGTPNVALGNNTLIIGGNNLSTTIGPISGAGGGALVKEGTGTLTLSGGNNYSGGTTVNAGTLSLTGFLSMDGALTVNGGAFLLNDRSQTIRGLSGAGGAIVLGQGTLTVGGSNDATLASTVSGIGVFNYVNSGTLTITGAHNTGTTIVDAGVVRLGAGGSLATGTLTVTGGTLDLNGHNVTVDRLYGNRFGAIMLGSGTLTFGNNESTIVPVTITGAGGQLVKTGTGTVTFTGTATHTGGTTISNGVLQLGIAGGASGSITGGIAVNASAALNVVNADTSGAGISNDGSVTFSNSSTAGTATIITNAGAQTQFSGNSTGGQVRLVVNAGGSLDISSLSSSGMTAGSIEGAGNFSLGGKQLTVGSNDLSTTVSGAIADGGSGGSLVKVGNGTLTLAGTNTYSGGTIVNAGTLQLGSTTALAAGSALTVNGGTFALGGNSVTVGALSGTGGVIDLGTATLTAGIGVDTTLASVISGSGALIKQGSGTLTLSGTNTYTGGTTVSAGTLQGSTTSLQGGIVNNATVVFDQSTSGSYAGVMSGTGNVAIQGGGVVTFTGVNTYTGSTTVNAATFNVNGSLAGSVSVGSSGTLGGSGTIGGNVVNSGTLAPGNPGSALAISGNLTHNSGATYKVTVSATAQNDRVNVGGTATINGGAVQVVVASGSYTPTTTYTILHATSGVSGTFSSVSSNYAFVAPSLSYDANNVFLTLTTNFAMNALTANQSAVGNALNSIGTSATGDMLSVLSALAVLNPSQGEYAIRSISGQNLASFSTTMVQTAQMFMNNLASQAGSAGGGNRVMMAEACDVACDTITPAQWGAWGGAVGGLGTIGAGQSVGAVTYNAGGFAAGLDRRFGPSFLAGVTVGFTTGTQWVSGFDGKATSDTYQVGLYGSFTQDRFYLDGMAGYGYAYNQSWRNIVIPGLQPRTAMGHAGANQFFGQLETGYRVDLGGTGQAYVTPFARLQGYTATQNAYTETGAQSLNLNVAGVTTNSLRSVLGAVVGGNMNVGWRSPIAGQLRLGWAHEYGNVDRPVAASFAGAPSVPFTTYGVSPTRDGVLMGLSLNTDVADGTALYLKYEGTISGQDSAQAMTAGVRIIW